MWDGKMKALTLSNDDGVEQDIRLISLMDKYGIKGTFNLNPGRQNYSDTFQKHDVTVHHLDLKDLPKVYAGHEIAGHSCTHPHLENLTGDRLREEVIGCKEQLSQLFGRKMYGFAYPYGTYNDEVKAVEKEAGIRYSRTVMEHHRFDLCENLLELPATCRHETPELLELAEQFVKLKPETPQMFYLWGHSYEFDEFDHWQLIEDFFKIISGKEDIFYGTNCEVLLDMKQV